MEPIKFERLVSILAEHARPADKDCWSTDKVARIILEDMIYLGFIDRSKVTMPKDPQ